MEPEATVIPPPRTPASKPLPESVLGDALLMALLLGLASFGLAATLRKKFSGGAGAFGPLLSCDLCVSFWTALMFVSIWWLATGLPVLRSTVVYFITVFFAAVGTAYSLAKFTGGVTIDPRFDTQVVDTNRHKD